MIDLVFGIDSKINMVSSIYGLMFYLFIGLLLLLLLSDYLCHDTDSLVGLVYLDHQQTGTMTVHSLSYIEM